MGTYGPYHLYIASHLVNEFWYQNMQIIIREAEKYSRKGNGYIDGKRFKNSELIKKRN